MTKPSWQDFATHDESAFPELWDGVVGAWAPCLGPTGSRLHDMSRRANWGTLTNMDNATDWVVRDGQYALDFDGSNDVVRNTTPNITLTTQATFSCWMRFTGSGGFRSAFGLYASATGNYMVLTTLNNVPYTELRTSTGAIGLGIGGTGFDTRNQWLHLVTFYTNSLAQMYVNGTLFAQDTTSRGTFGAITIIDVGDGGNFSLPFLGTVDDCVIWNRALSQNEIRQLYQLGRGGMYQRRRRRRLYAAQAGFQAAWALRRSQIIGGGLR